MMHTADWQGVDHSIIIPPKQKRYALRSMFASTSARVTLSPADELLRGAAVVVEHGLVRDHMHRANVYTMTSTKESVLIRIDARDATDVNRSLAVIIALAVCMFMLIIAIIVAVAR
jgi:hypothetical protein